MKIKREEEKSETPKTKKAKNNLNTPWLTPFKGTTGELGAYVPTKKDNTIPIVGFRSRGTRTHKLTNDKQKKTKGEYFKCQRQLEKLCLSIFYLVSKNPGCDITFLKKDLCQRYRNRVKGLLRKMLDEGSIREENGCFYAVDKNNIQYLPRRTRSMSALENSVVDILTRLGIHFVQQFKTPLCKSKKMLPFDFAIWVSGQLLLIEMDGKQHSSPVSIFGGQQAFEEQCKKDAIKNAFCKENGIPLLRMDYTVPIKKREEAIVDFVNSKKTNFVGKSY